MNKGLKRDLRTIERLQRLINREGNAVRLDFYMTSEPSEDDTPDIDIDATPFDGYEAADYDTPKGERE